MLKLPTDTKYQAVNYIETYTGRMFYPLDPNPADVSIIDIAHALSNQCRYSGHTVEFYSVAQHCCLLANYTSQARHGSALDCLQILIHDAAEAYLIDTPRPIKQHMPEYRAWDYGINTAIRTWLGLTDVPMPPFQDEIDSRIIQDERIHLMSDSGNDWKHPLKPLGIPITPWTPKVAESHFLLQYAAYTFAVYGRHQYINEEWNAGQLKAAVSDTASDSTTIEDVVEIDLRGGVGRVKLRTPNGMLVRDQAAGKMPRARSKWVHGHFELVVP